MYSDDEAGAPFVGATLEKAVSELNGWAAMYGKVADEVQPVTNNLWIRQDIGRKGVRG